ncbi:MAG: prolipoprotein diacylglyceryl transferase, partial [Phycisphaerae bacterium]|nr:prolipoprotein diacylglyceryl transferase [Phycisphaerae bacterium]
MLALFPYPDIDPVVFSFGPFSVRWYGLAYVTGFVLAYLWLRRLITIRILRITFDQLNDLLSYLVFGVVVGGRTGWWIFYH